MLKKWVVLIDLSGTLHVGDAAIPGAIEALDRLQAFKDRIVIRYVSNTTKESLKCIYSRLLRCGFTGVQQSQIFSSLSAAHRLICKQGLRPMLFLEPEALSDFQDVPISNPNAVVIGLTPSKLDFKAMNEAFRLLLKDESVPLIAVHRGRYYRDDTGQLSLGPGPFVRCLEFAANRVAHVVGKPEPLFFEEAISSAKVNEGKGFVLADIVMIGDDVRDDVLGAVDAGLRGVLVRTGKYLSGDELEIPIDKRHCVNDFREAVELVLQWIANESLLQRSCKVEEDNKSLN